MTGTDSPHEPALTRPTQRVSFEVEVDSRVVRGWHYTGLGERFATARGNAAVVMAHGIGATMDSALPEFATALSATGLDVVAFDYRNFGASDGEHRQVASPTAQLTDYRAAITATRRIPRVDPERILVWGVSFSGGHVFALAGTDPRIAGVIALTPAPDGAASAANILRRNGLRHVLRCTWAGLKDQFGALLGRRPLMVPIVGRPGTLAALNSDDALEKHLQMAGPTWRNELAARIFLRIAAYDPIAMAGRIGVPVLVQVADFDQSAPPAAAMRAAHLSGAEVRHYPCDHFDVYPGQQWHEAVVAHQIDFVTRHFAASR
ncbi:alpha/beta hydrolase [Mycolicibacterium palauense]|uniref:alpha/beta hydrolase n=1 Tax=Mycolicibacterium palauense TaxID=2034511 RepID=UPI000BFEF775|nr:alpha/beta fold hydrolase [Mycolicibacterium palauense]